MKRFILIFQTFRTRDLTERENNSCFLGTLDPFKKKKLWPFWSRFMFFIFDKLKLYIIMSFMVIHDMMPVPSVVQLLNRVSHLRLRRKICTHLYASSHWLASHQPPRVLPSLSGLPSTGPLPTRASTPGRSSAPAEQPIDYEPRALKIRAVVDPTVRIASRPVSDDTRSG